MLPFKIFRVRAKVRVGRAKEEKKPGQTRGGRWDSFARLWKALLSSVPTVTTMGNHDILEMAPKGTPFFAQNAKGSCKDFGCPMTFTARQKAYRKAEGPCASRAESRK